MLVVGMLLVPGSVAVLVPLSVPEGSVLPGSEDAAVSVVFGPIWGVQPKAAVSARVAEDGRSDIFIKNSRARHEPWSVRGESVAEPGDRKGAARVRAAPQGPRWTITPT